MIGMLYYFMATAIIKRQPLIYCFYFLPCIQFYLSSENEKTSLDSTAPFLHFYKGLKFGGK